MLLTCSPPVRPKEPLGRYRITNEELEAHVSTAYLRPGVSLRALHLCRMTYVINRDVVALIYKQRLSARHRRASAKCRQHKPSFLLATFLPIRPLKRISTQMEHPPPTRNHTWAQDLITLHANPTRLERLNALSYIVNAL